MKKMLLGRIAALGLSAALLFGAAVPAGAFTINIGDTSINVDDKVAQERYFQEGLEALFENYDFGEASPELFDALGALKLETIQRMNADAEAKHNDPADIENDATEAKYQFDKATGTITGVTVIEGNTLVIPKEIDGVTVKQIAPGAMDGLNVMVIVLPHTVEKVTGVIARNCPELVAISVAPTTVVTGRVYENCPKMGSRGEGSDYMEFETTDKKTNLPQSLLKEIGVFKGDDKGNQNWKGGLTRAEAATIILRLMGAEEQAQAMVGDTSPFSDVPQWANGYVNYAYANGVVKGVGDGKFDPAGACGAKEFCVMLLRLTDYREGTDYAWETAIEDAQRLVGKGRALMNKQTLDGDLFTRLFNETTFTREYACALTYRMLSAPTGGGGYESLADRLARKGAVPGVVCVDYGVRMTLRAIGDGDALSLYLTDAKKPDTIRIADGKLTVTTVGPYEAALSAAPIDGGGTDKAASGGTLRLTGPIRLFIELTRQKGDTSYGWSFGSIQARQDENGDYYLATSDNQFLRTYLRTRNVAGKEAALAGAKDASFSADIQTLADQLAAGKSGNYAKADAICAWVAANISYDYDTLKAMGSTYDRLTGTKPTGGLTAAAQDADTVLATKKGVCAGYASLTYALMNAAGVPCIRASSVVADHAWNEAYVDGRWIVIDNTWDVGERSYFDMPMDQFAASHPMGEFKSEPSSSSRYYY